MSNLLAKIGEYLRPTHHVYNQTTAYELKQTISNAFNVPDANYGTSAFRLEVLTTLVGQELRVKDISKIFSPETIAESGAYSPRLDLNGSLQEWYAEAQEKLTPQGFRYFKQAMANAAKDSAVRNDDKYFVINANGPEQIDEAKATETYRQISWKRVTFSTLGTLAAYYLITGAVGMVANNDYQQPLENGAKDPQHMRVSSNNSSSTQFNQVSYQTTPVPTALPSPTATQVPLNTLQTAHFVSFMDLTNDTLNDLPSGRANAAAEQVCFKGYELPASLFGENLPSSLVNHGTLSQFMNFLNTALSRQADLGYLDLTGLNVIMPTVCTLSNSSNPSFVYPTFNFANPDTAMFVAITDPSGNLRGDMTALDAARFAYGYENGETLKGNYVKVMGANGVTQWVEVDWLANYLESVKQGPGFGRPESWSVVKHSSSYFMPNLFSNSLGATDVVNTIYLAANVNPADYSAIQSGNLNLLQNLNFRLIDGLKVAFNGDFSLNVDQIFAYAMQHPEFMTQTRLGLSQFPGYNPGTYGDSKVAINSCFPIETAFQNAGLYPHLPKGYTGSDANAFNSLISFSQKGDPVTRILHIVCSVSEPTPPPREVIVVETPSSVDGGGGENSGCGLDPQPGCPNPNP